MRSVPFCYNIAIHNIRAMVVVIVVVAVVVVVIVVVIVVIAVVVVVVTDKGKRIHGEVIIMVNCNTGAVEDIVSIRSITVPFFVLSRVFNGFTIIVIGFPMIVVASGEIAKVSIPIIVKIRVIKAAIMYSTGRIKSCSWYRRQ